MQILAALTPLWRSVARKLQRVTESASIVVAPSRLAPPPDAPRLVFGASRIIALRLPPASATRRS